MKLKALLSGLTLVLFCTIGFAQTKKTAAQQKQVAHQHQFIQKQAVQQQKIKQGVKSGKLTKHEATQLRTQQKDIAKTKYAAKADGVVTKKERTVIHQKQKAADRNIHHKKQNKIKKK